MTVEERVDPVEERVDPATGVSEVLAGALESGAPVRVDRDGPTRFYVTDEWGQITLVQTRTIARRHHIPDPFDLGEVLDRLAGRDCVR